MSISEEVKMENEIEEIKSSEVLVERKNFVNDDGERVSRETFPVDKSCVNNILKNSKGKIRIRVNKVVKYVSDEGLRRIYRLFEDNVYASNMRSRVKDENLEKQIEREEARLNKMKKEMNKK